MNVLERGRRVCGESARGCRCVWEGRTRAELLRGRARDCVEYSERVTGGARVREVHVIETHGLERREARARSGRAVVDVLQGSRDSFLFLLFGFYVQMLVGGACGGYIRIV